jgi:cation diffusion facilitator CzcD-associated flavoprotein CzcO
MNGRPDHVLPALVVGGGFAGIGMGIALKRAGLDFQILEAAEDVGGTWRDNVYPGVAVDIPSFTYSFSFEQRPTWSRVFAEGRELHDYAHHCVQKYGLAPHIRYGAKAEEARYREEDGTWQVTLASGTRLAARVLISATGLLTQPKYPEIPGLERFAGRVIHSARWPVGTSLAGQRVAIIGTGATSVQLVPALAPAVSKLHVFQRTPIWVLPKLDAPLGRAAHALFSGVPTSQHLLRMVTTLGTEAVMVLAIVYQREFPWLVSAVERVARTQLRVQVHDRRVREALTPRYGFGCKRPSFSNTYLPSFNRANVALETGGIRAITEHGITTADGRELPIDTLVCATGFRTYEKGNLPTYRVVGKAGRELGEFWERERYQAYLGASVPGFPSFFLMVGPYAATGSSWFAMIENQAAHITRCLDLARARGASRIEVTQAAHDRYFAEVLRRQKSTVFFNHQCSGSHSYYFDKHGDAVFYRPASGLEAYLTSRHFSAADYSFA